MKLFQFGALILTGILLSACAAHKQARWYKEGVSREDTENQLEKCRYDINMARDVSIEKETKLLKHCMRKEGFRWVYR